jgi:hypothetical protein
VLDLGDIGPEIGQERRRQRSREQRRRLEDFHAVKGSRPKATRRSRVHPAHLKPMVSERSRPPPVSTSLKLTSGSFGPPSAYQSEPSAT